MTSNVTLTRRREGVDGLVKSIIRISIMISLSVRLPIMISLSVRFLIMISLSVRLPIMIRLSVRLPIMISLSVRLYANLRRPNDSRHRVHKGHRVRRRRHKSSVFIVAC